MNAYFHKIKSIYFLMIIVGSLVVVEICLPFFSTYGYFTPEILRNRILPPQAQSLFWKYIFPTKAEMTNPWNDVQVTENYRRWSINNMGYRGPDFSMHKPDSVIRIIIYGCMFVAPPKEDWPRRVEKILKKNGFPDVEIIDATTPGHSSLDCFGRLFLEGYLFNPDYIIFYDGWNDIKYFNSQKPLLRELKPFSDDPRLYYQGALDRFLCEHSQLFVRLRQRYYNRKISRNKKHRKLGDKIGDIGPAQYKLIHEVFVDLARDIGAVPVLMTQARLVKQDNSASDKVRIRYDFAKLNHEAICDAYREMDRIIKQVAESKGAFLIDASKNLTGKSELFEDHVHLTNTGADSLAAVTARHLELLLNGKIRSPVGKS